MANILNIKTSISGEGSVSSKLSQIVIDRLLEKDPLGRVVVRDLATEPIPHLELQHFNAFNIKDEDKNTREKEVSRFSDEAIKEIQEADIIVIGVPFYNFSIPSTLKSWIDHISIAGKTFSYADGTLKGLLEDKKVYLNFAVGGIYDNGIVESMEQYLRTFFGFIGITDLKVFRTEGTMIPEFREDNLQKTVAEIETVIV
ncbi:MAG: NAD(P)H-dependent oxidoreductase [Chryseobacterium sp.]|jgi:FMN-dependent NADH-azoreductase|uniref:FMN-dependent NADH-azoreductase n=1 Tax=Chryseobacterium sp. TaxID=1871047 RepID=UPI0028325FE6|nr:NAD(P)H-dependent oxidoreductase [Chryseobacterium sp.]MDR2235018.1 NAD(P)H-dependent oxidoreductase [Chryseobacterium sp.]